MFFFLTKSMIKHFPFIVFLLLISLHSFSQRVVVKSNPTVNDRFSKKSGSLRLSTTIVKIGKIRNNETRTDTIKIFNDGAGDLSIALGKTPQNLRVSLGTEILNPKSESWIAVTYSASGKNDYGFVVDRFELVTNDSIQPKKSISVTAYIVEYFPPITADDSSFIQKAKWIETTFDYGKIRQGSKVTHNFEVINVGKRDLYVRITKSDCECLRTIASTDTIAPGVTGYVSIEFDSNHKEGKDSRKMNVYINDPSKPEVVLELKGEIEK